MNKELMLVNMWLHMARVFRTGVDGMTQPVEMEGL